MRRVRVLYHLARADFLERVRRYSFLLTMVFAAGLGYAAYAGKIHLELDEYRGVYNSAWVGSMMTLVCTAFITLAGFYIVKNTVQRDEQTRVGLVLATTPMSRSLYTVGKALSNFAVLTAMVAVLAVAAVILQLARAEGGGLEPYKLLAPFAWVAMPAVSITAAVAVLFETLPVLRGGVGNVVYFFAWSASLGASGAAGVDDFAGLGFFRNQMASALHRIDPTYKDGFALQAGPTAHATKTFLWNGVDWTLPVIMARLKWVAIAFGIAWLSALFFHRFDPARERRAMPKRARVPGEAASSVPEQAIPATSARVPLTPLAHAAPGNRFPRLVISELGLMLKGLRWWWYLVAVGLLVASVVIPDIQARRALAAIAWLWPVLIWSKMGSREARYGTEALVFSCAHSLDRQLPAVWAAGVAVAILTAGGIATSGFSAWFAAALFVPALALALGAWSGSSKPFEALYTMWWYVGPMNHIAGPDFTGMAAARLGTIGYLAAAITLLGAAYFGRRRKLGYA